MDKVVVMVRNQKTKAMEPKSKIFNTLNLPFLTDKELTHHLSMYSGNIKSYRTSYYK